MEVENLEHLQRVAKYRMEVMEGDAVPSPQPRWDPKKPFTFVNATLVERLEDLKRGQHEIHTRMITLEFEKTQEEGNCVEIL